MPEEVTHDPELGLIRIRSSGILKRQEMDKSVLELERLNKATGINRVLIRGEWDELPPPGPLFDFLTQLDTKWKFAIVMVSIKLEEREHFMQNVVANRGIPVRYFAAEPEAIEWLKD